ncbi:hypothetical protein C8R44DRAFT_880420 [Mycena epipterygia]|nr:hypothetical protein C8R44DRAFT_880420 [Mycena epipterygia]
MFSLISTTARKQAGRSWLGLRRVHHDVGRPGIIYPVEHINIAPRFESAPAGLPPLSSRPQALLGPVLSAETIERVGPDGKRIQMKSISVKPVPIIQWLAFAVGVALIFRGFRARYNAMLNRVEVMQRIVHDAPSIEVLRQDERALAEHLSALINVALPSKMREGAAQVIARHRTEGDTAIGDACEQLHAILKNNELGPMGMLYDSLRILSRFIDPNFKGPVPSFDPRESAPTVPESSFSEPSEQTTDYPPLQ